MCVRVRVCVCVCVSVCLSAFTYLGRLAGGEVRDELGVGFLHQVHPACVHCIAYCFGSSQPATLSLSHSLTQSVSQGGSEGMMEVGQALAR